MRARCGNRTHANMNKTISTTNTERKMSVDMGGGERRENNSPAFFLLLLCFFHLSPLPPSLFDFFFPSSPPHTSERRRGGVAAVLSHFLSLYPFPPPPLLPPKPSAGSCFGFWGTRGHTHTRENSVSSTTTTICRERERVSEWELGGMSACVQVLAEKRDGDGERRKGENPTTHLKVLWPMVADSRERGQSEQEQRYDRK